MDVKVCKNCRRLFKYMFGPELCQDCAKVLVEDKKEINSVTDQNKNAQELLINNALSGPIKPLVQDEEAKFEQVRDYIMTHPSASVSQISDVNEVLPTKLFEWIREDRLAFSDTSENAWFVCAKCGVKIKSGRLCNGCKIK